MCDELNMQVNVLKTRPDVKIIKHNDLNIRRGDQIQMKDGKKISQVLLIAIICL